jgi:hypothetical protein
MLTTTAIPGVRGTTVQIKSRREKRGIRQGLGKLTPTIYPVVLLDLGHGAQVARIGKFADGGRKIRVKMHKRDYIIDNPHA